MNRLEAKIRIAIGCYTSNTGAARSQSGWGESAPQIVLMTMMTIRRPPRQGSAKLFDRPLSPRMDMSLGCPG
jgi:hypothetical protein